MNEINKPHSKVKETVLKTAKQEYKIREGIASISLLIIFVEQRIMKETILEIILLFLFRYRDSSN